MGEYADEIIDRYIDGHWGFSHRSRPRSYQARSGRFCWRDAHGVIHDMRDMSVSHLQAALRKCRAEKNTGKAADLEAALAKKMSDLLKPVDNP